MKTWGWALGLSLCLHLTVVAAFLRPAQPKPTKSLPEGTAPKAIAVSLWRKGETPKAVALKPMRMAPKVTATEKAPTVGPSEDAGQKEAVSSDGLAGGSSETPSENTIDLSNLYQRLSESARGCYPQRAKRFRLEGLAQVSFCLAENGQLQTAKLEKSSGHAPLDVAATECVVPNAMPFHAPSGCYSVPVRFASME